MQVWLGFGGAQQGLNRRSLMDEMTVCANECYRTACTALTLCLTHDLLFHLVRDRPRAVQEGLKTSVSLLLAVDSSSSLSPFRSLWQFSPVEFSFFNFRYVPPPSHSLSHRFRVLQFPLFNSSCIHTSCVLDTPVTYSILEQHPTARSVTQAFLYFAA